VARYALAAGQLDTPVTVQVRAFAATGFPEVTWDIVNATGFVTQKC
jgi:hypothetical protein